MEKYIFLDFNGTVLDDIDLCLEILNELLAKQNKPFVNKERYFEIFGFPVIDYYVRAGLDISNFEEQAKYFIEEYTRRNVLECKIYDDFLDFVDKARNASYKIVLCSASKYDLLVDQLKHFKILDCFDDVIALDNYHAKSKVDVAMNYIKQNKIDSNQLYFIGDTDHDALVAKECGGHSYLVARGHQNKNILAKTDSIICDTLLDALDKIEKEI